MARSNLLTAGTQVFGCLGAFVAGPHQIKKRCRRDVELQGCTCRCSEPRPRMGHTTKMKALEWSGASKIVLSAPSDPRMCTGLSKMTCHRRMRWRVIGAGRSTLLSAWLHHNLRCTNFFSFDPAPTHPLGLGSTLTKQRRARGSSSQDAQHLAQGFQSPATQSQNPHRQHRIPCPRALRHDAAVVCPAPLAPRQTTPVP